ncbi:asparagine synthase-related protein [Actinokineospora pegani]|uniref:asparagine synthase-related protein n=1 Tax=Actinokineospora pegani TaxID=2654637 RepID=UPI0012EB0067|nr:asparagine synthase-related protein [Actinokineospora pegani]
MADDLGTGFGWYAVALPDTERSRGIAGRIAAPVVAEHASGRPWLVSTHPAEQVVLVAEGDARIAVLGFSDASEHRLRRAARGGDTGVDDLANGLAGCHVVAASLAGKSTVLGSASGVTRVFTATVDGCPVVADRADVLADLIGASCDPVALAARMVRSVPHPMAELPLWPGVEPVPPGSRVTVDPDGARSRTSTWWRRPEPVLSRAEGALRLAAALEDAVHTRTRAGGTVYADISGGFDSTPQVHFASRGRARVIAGTAYNGDPGGGEDLFWAQRALESMPTVEHRTFSTEDMPVFYAGLLEVHTRLDDSSDAYRAAPRLLTMMRGAVDLGARAYLNGIGGDDLLVGFPKYEHTLFRRRPVKALRRLRDHQLIEGLSVRETFGRLLDRRDYRQWLTDSLRTARERDDFARPRLGMDWDHPLHWPRWFGTDLRAAVTGRVLATGAQPLGPTIAAHSELAAIRQNARIVRGARQLGAGLGLAFESPISDDRVADAVLSVRHEERFHPKEFKPLMREAMRGRLPDAFLERSRKNSGTPQAARGLRDHHADLVALCEESPLVAMGVVDAAVLRAHAFPGERWKRVRDIDTTINAAVFTRAHAGTARQAAP